jgi:acyl-coenzyme A synthetase/AMP-(fatty) acid ligase
MVVSATAPLEAGLVREVEEHLQSRVLEIYGCSEVGSLAWRLPRREENWQFYDCFDLSIEDGTITIGHPQLPVPVALTDVFEHVEGGHYRLLGRSTDIVKVGGKRDSLARLNGLLAGIEGVVDGYFYQPEDHGLPATGRLGAVVVAPTLSDRQLRQALSTRVDPVFLPRPLHRAEALPRDATSKLQRAALTDLLHRLHGSMA